MAQNHHKLIILGSEPAGYTAAIYAALYLLGLQNIWQNSEIFKNLCDFKKYKGKCDNCEYIKIHGGCRARAHFMKGDYLAEEPLCH